MLERGKEEIKMQHSVSGNSRLEILSLIENLCLVNATPQRTLGVQKTGRTLQAAQALDPSPDLIPSDPTEVNTAASQLGRQVGTNFPLA